MIDTSGPIVFLRLGAHDRGTAATPASTRRVKGIQVLNDMGNIRSAATGASDSDTPARRKIIENLRNWNAFSNSSPEG